jgi:tetratricopeptide (TPR) repeat protein
MRGGPRRAKEVTVSPSPIRLLVLATLLAPFLGRLPAADAPGKEQVARWIKDLGDGDFNVRESASRKLWEAGRAAEAALAGAAHSDDAEVARRAQELVDKFRWGIYPDTPPKVVQLITRYQGGNAAAKLAVVKELFDAGGPGCAALLKIARAEPDVPLRQRLFAQIGQDSSRAIPALLADGKFDTVEELLELGVAAEAEAALPSYACYWLLRGGLDRKIARFQAESAGADGRRAFEVLAYLHRARGDLSAARAAAEKAGKPDLLEAILYEQGNWKALARRHNPGGADREIEAHGFRAAYQRLAGDRDEFEKTVARIRELAGARADDAEVWFGAKALFLNDRPQDALALLARGKRSAVTTVEVLCAQLKFREALALADGVKADDPDRPLLDVLCGRALYTLGEKDRALALFNGLAARVKEGNETEWQERLIAVEQRLGLKEQAQEHCARVLEASPSAARQSRLLERVFPRPGEAAAAWWRFLRRKYRGSEPPAATLRRLPDVLAGTLADKEFVALAQEVESPAGLNPAEHELLLLAVAEAALASGRAALGRAYLEKAAAVQASPEPLLRLGDDLAARKEWPAAAERYAQAWARDPKDPLPLYLRGLALVQAGKEKEGRKWQEMAHLLPLGNEPVRNAFAEALARRGQLQAARRERDLLRKVSAPDSFYAGEALRQAALDAAGRKEYLKAADLHERAMLRCLDARISFVDAAAYVAVPHFVHRQRARGFAAAGRLEEMRREVQLCLAALPGDVDLPIGVVPELEKRGRTKEAEELYRGCRAVHEALCRDHPRSAWAHNSLAWLAACCRRDLDGALGHALKAVGLAPDTAGYHDTLGEVYFQRGDKEKALAAAHKAVALDPGNAYYRKQLRRIEAGDRRAELPSTGEDE